MYSFLLFSFLFFVLLGSLSNETHFNILVYLTEKANLQIFLLLWQPVSVGCQFH